MPSTAPWTGFSNGPSRRSDDVVAQITDAREKGAPIDNVHRIVLPDRRVKYIYSMGHVEYGDDGEPIRIVGTSQDVTQQKLAEMQKEESEQRLLQAQKLEAIGTLAGGIAHDFNNILTSIIGFTQRAAHLLPENSPAIKKLDIVLQAGMRARDLVDHILAFSGRANPNASRFKPVLSSRRPSSFCGQRFRPISRSNRISRPNAAGCWPTRFRSIRW